MGGSCFFVRILHKTTFPPLDIVNECSLKLVHFRKNRVVCSSAAPEILAFGSHCSAIFRPILDCFIPNFKLKYKDSENIEAAHVNTIISNLHQIKRRVLFWDTR